MHKHVRDIYRLLLAGDGNITVKDGSIVIPHADVIWEGRTFSSELFDMIRSLCVKTVGGKEPLLKFPDSKIVKIYFNTFDRNIGDWIGFECEKK